MTDLFDKCLTDSGYFGHYRLNRDRYFTQPILGGIPAPRMTFQGREVIMWAINNYLGLADNKEIKEVARKAIEKWGTFSPMGSRMLTGNTEQHIALEQKLAGFLQKPSAILFNYGYLGVIGTITSLIDKNDQIIMDRLSHASMVDGTTLASYGKRFRAFQHNDMQDLENQLKEANRDRKGGLLIVTEGVFGMRGDLADLKSICELCKKYEARLFVDDAHGFGVMGENGRGLGEHFGVQDKIDIYLGTFAKAFAAIGGVAAAEEAPVEYIRYNARTQVFAKSLPMVFVEVLSATLDIVKNKPEIRKKMWHITGLLQKGLTELGYDIGDTQSPITPVYVPAGDPETGMSMIKMLREEYGIFVSGVAYPVVPKGVVLFRMIPTASHTEEDVEKTLDAYRNLRDRLKVDLSLKPSKMNR
jgi:glycine C-acetyltransferase